MLTAKQNFEDMGPEWNLSLACEATSQAGGADNNGAIDLELFPDLQDMKKSYSRSASQETNGEEVAEECDDELISYFHRADSTPTKAPVAQRANMAHLLTKPGVVKVVSLRQGVVDGTGKIVVVEEKNRPKRNTAVDQLTFSTSNPIPYAEPTSTSPCSSAGDSDSILGQQHDQGQQLCMSKNAIMARENRLRKKHHVQQLEESVEKLSTENTVLRNELTETKSTIETLRSELTYLKSVLANQSTLAKLLENIPMIPGLAIGKTDAALSVTSNTSRQTSRKRSAQVEQADSLNSDEECDCHPDKNVCMCSKENQHSKSKKSRVQLQDGKQTAEHSYATEEGDQGNSSSKSTGRTTKGKTRSSSTTDDETSGGVCLHVSGSSVSLEFCSSCSKQAVGGKRKNSK